MIFSLFISIFFLSSSGHGSEIIGGEEAGRTDAPWQVNTGLWRVNILATLIGFSEKLFRWYFPFLWRKHHPRGPGLNNLQQNAKKDNRLGHSSLFCLHTIQRLRGLGGYGLTLPGRPLRPPVWRDGWPAQHPSPWPAWGGETGHQGHHPSQLHLEWQGVWHRTCQGGNTL